MTVKYHYPNDSTISQFASIRKIVSIELYIVLILFIKDIKKLEENLTLKIVGIELFIVLSLFKDKKSY